MLDSQPKCNNQADTVDMCMKYLSTDWYMLDTLCKPVDIHWDVPNDIMSQYNSHYYCTFGLKGIKEDIVKSIQGAM